MRVDHNVLMWRPDITPMRVKKFSETRRLFQKMGERRDPPPMFVRTVYIIYPEHFLGTKVVLKLHVLTLAFQLEHPDVLRNIYKVMKLQLLRKQTGR